MHVYQCAQLLSPLVLYFAGNRNYAFFGYGALYIVFKIVFSVRRRYGKMYFDGLFIVYLQ